MDNLQKRPEHLFDVYDLCFESLTTVQGMLVEAFRSNYSFRQMLHRHKYYEIFICTSGTGTHQLDFSTYPIQPHSIHFIRPGQVHKIAMNPPYAGYFVMFHPDMLIKHAPTCRPDQLTCFFQDNPIVNKPLARKLATIIEDMLTFKTPDILTKEMYQSALLCQLLLIAEQQHKALFPQANTASLSSQFLTLLAHAIPPLSTIEQYAQQLHTHPNYLNNVVKVETGRTAGSWIQEARLLESKRLLSYTTLTISTISYALNFSEPAAFCRFFKRLAGVNPKSFRQSLL